MGALLTKEEVQRFWDQFHSKMKVFDILYKDDRGKNLKALEISFHLAESPMKYPFK